MSVQILRAASRPVSRWRNGGGETSEIARHPSSAEEDWWWRASIATIAQDGAFSPFPGCDRIIVPLDGALRLDIDGTPTDVPRHGVLRFRGEDDVRAVDVAQPTTDLTIIVSRDLSAADLRIVTAPESRFGPGRGQSLLIVALSDDVAADAVTLAPLDAVLVTAGDELVVRHGSVAVIELSGSPEW
ncbi:HutD family protein [Rathayibacter tanaceti]|uniref:HutD family protein n=2 Tax=Rathayibacter tanaceti TaxID=1671680 RepID=A0A166I3R7_9MICO|nr:HutD family protein [Rathayibacter tanaceti]KZX21583.1 hypothetical protein ACH61_01288 [Rathayibacter tanaceti]QHC56638.1 HutD family protein [Rathayibacter tanaceti]TCO36217.1 hypothetical protein EV639_10882 [Rathayibacter tanaceti]